MSEMRVTLVANATQPVGEIGKLRAAADSTAKSFQNAANAAERSARGAVGSFKSLEAELKANEAILKRLAVGSRAFDEQRQKVDQLRGSLRAAKQEMANGANGIGRSGQAVIEQIGTMAASFFTLRTIIDGIVFELEKANRIGQEAANQRRTLDQALADVGVNIGADAVPQARRMIVESQTRLGKLGIGTTQEGLANILGTAISAGAKDLEESMKLAEATLQLTAGDANKANALVAGTLDIATLGGMKDYRQALGQLLQTQSESRAVGLQDFVNNIGPGIAAATAQGMHQNGVSTERALEISAVIGQIIKDPTGANTATTMRQLFTRMDSFAPELQKKLDDGGTASVDQATIDKFMATRDFDARLQMMRENQGLALQFLETQRESIGKTAVREIIIQSDRAREFEDKAKKKITDPAGALGEFDKLAGAVDAVTGVVRADRRAAANIAERQVTGVAAEAGQAKKIFDETIAQVNLPGPDFIAERVERGLAMTRASGSKRPAEAYARSLEDMLNPELRATPIVGEDAEFIRRQAAELRKMQADMDRMNGESGDQFKARAIFQDTVRQLNLPGPDMLAKPIERFMGEANVEKSNDKVEAWAKALEALLDPRQRGSVVTGADAEFVREQVAAIRSLKEELVKQNDIGRQQRDLLAQMAGRRAEQRPVDRQPQAASAP